MIPKSVSPEMFYKLSALMRELKSLGVLPELGKKAHDGNSIYWLTDADGKYITSITPALIDEEGEEFILGIEYESCMNAVRDHFSESFSSLAQPNPSGSRIVPFRRA